MIGYLSGVGRRFRVAWSSCACRVLRLPQLPAGQSDFVQLVSSGSCPEALIVDCQRCMLGISTTVSASVNRIFQIQRDIVSRFWFIIAGMINCVLCVGQCKVMF